VSPWSLRIPLRFLRGNYTRFALTVIALVCGVALVCAVDLVNRAVLHAFVEVVDTMAGRAALYVSAGDGGLFPEEIARDVESIPGVALAVPVVSAAGFVSGASGELVTIHGVDITNEAAVRVYEARDAGGVEIEDPLVFLSQPDSVVLTRTFAERRGLKINSNFQLVTPRGVQTFTVRGLLEPEGVARVYGGNLVVMDLFAAEAAFTRPGFINRVDVVVEGGQELTDIEARLAVALPPGVRVGRSAHRKTDLSKIVQSLQLLLSGVGLIGLVAAFLIAFNRLTTVFEGRAWQLGMLRAVGVRSAAVSRELLKEAFVLAAAGVALGIPLGIALGRLLLPVIATTTALNYKLVATEPSLAVRPVSLLLAGLLGLGAALFAATLPARRAARVAIAETVRHRGIEQAGLAPRSFWSIRAGVLITAAGTLVMQRALRSASWGLVATALLAIACALAARPLLYSAHRILHSSLQNLLGPAGRFAAASLERNPRRSALAMSVLGVGVGSVLWLWTMGKSFEHSVIDSLSGAFRADLTVTSAHVASGFDGAPIDGGLVADVATVPGVSAAIGERIADWHHAGGPVAIDAFDPLYFHSTHFGGWTLLGQRLPDAWGRVARGDGVVVSTSFVLNLGTSVGDALVLETPNGPLPLVVVGMTNAFASPRGTIEMSRAVYERFWNDDQITRVHVRLDDPARSNQVAEAIRARVGTQHHIHVLTATDLLAYWTAQVRRAFAFTDVLAGLVLFVVLIGMADTLTASVAERTRELGTFRALGVRQRYLALMVVIEGIALGILGLVLAVILASFLGVLWVQATFPYLLGWILQLHVPGRETALVTTAVILVCVLAALVPARRAARLQPATALRYE
jgi:putative ABC transport system permease protein